MGAGRSCQLDDLPSWELADLASSTIWSDPFGWVHGIRNLVVTGSGLFLTTGGTSPTFTLPALAERAVAELVAHWGDHV